LPCSPAQSRYELPGAKALAAQLRGNHGVLPVRLILSMV